MSSEPASAAHPTSVLLAGGGTAGHVSPMLALADAIRRRWPDCSVACLGTETGLEARIVPERGYPLHVVPKVPLPRKPSADLLRLPGRLNAAVVAADRAITETGAQVVVGFGGYVATPAYLAARRRRIPVVIHEQNARPGLANRLGARFTPYVATTFASTPLRGATRIGMPLRPQITELDRAAVRPLAAREFGVDPALPTIVVTGGSLGAARLNTAFAGAAEQLSAAGVQVIHVTGRGKTFTPEGGSGAAYVVLEYADQMERVLACADLVVARAGANTVCELTALGLPAIYVPLPIGNGEQRLNAADAVAAGGALLVDDAEVTPEWVASVVIPLASDPARLSQMAAASASVGELAADDRLADLVAQAFVAGQSARRK